MTYPHSARTEYGPCYLWGQNNPYKNNIPPGAYHIGDVGWNAADTVCGVPLYFTARLRDLTHTDTVAPIYYLEPVTGSNTTVAASYWKTSRPDVLHLGGLTGTGFAAVITDFLKPIKKVTVRFRCAVIPGFRLEARASDGGVLASKDVPTVPAGPDPNYRCGNPIVFSDVALSAPSISEIVAYGPPSGTLHDNELFTGVGVEYWIEPDTISHLQITVAKGTDRWIGDTVQYQASTSDGSRFTITSWTWTADSGKTPPLGITEKVSVQSKCNGSKPLNPCLHTPVTNGTIRVIGTIGKKTDTATRQLTVTMPRISVACGPLVGEDTILHIAGSPAPGVPVLRGQTTYCHAVVYHRPWQLSKWIFTPDDQSVGTISMAATSSWDWNGPAVAAGAVTVEGTVNGIAAISDTARLNVKFDTLRFPIDSAKADTGQFDCGFSVPAWTIRTPTQFRLAWTRVPGRCGTTEDSKPVLDPNPRLTAAVFDTENVVPAGGPNAGLWYVRNLAATRLWLRTQVMRDLRDNGAHYVLKAEERPGQGCGLPDGTSAFFTTLVVDGVCMQSTAGNDMVSWAWRHEGCHMARAADVLTNSDTTNAKLESILRVVSKDSTIVHEATRNLLTLINDSAFDYSKGLDVGSMSWIVWSPPEISLEVWATWTWRFVGSISPTSICI